ncbi:hypothetical protein TWF718_000419 [Orbilia javanica]|uniref:Fungal STAND N-terminal Goodbye domain-containing protein n=1 Tax=Orbilia javanica TaxID=47235 RepID=A0AAN8N801_9PEZI
MDTPQDQFAAIWAAAMERYQRASGVDLAAVQLPELGDIDSLKREIEDSQSRFEGYRNVRASLWGSLGAVLGPVEVLGGAVAEGTSAVFPASTAIMGAVSVLIRAARGVSQSYDYLQELFDDTKVVLARLKIHARKNISLELRAVFIEILSCILEIIGVSTKYVADGRAKRFVKGIFMPDDDPASQLKERLKKLVDQETATVGALSLDMTSDVLTQTMLTGDISRNMDIKINGIVDSLGKIFEQIGAGSDAAPAKIKAINFTIPLHMPFPRNSAFTGREKELKAIDKCFTRSEPSSGDAPVVCALIGTGGMGKTQVALQYAYQQSEGLTAVFWVSATAEEAVRTSFVDIMQQIVTEQAKVSWPESTPDYEALSIRLGIPGHLDNNGIVSSDPRIAGDIQSALFDWLQLPGNQKWLLIFDNADDLETFSVQDYFPKHGGGAILVTSRRPEFSHCAEQVELDGLDEDNAVKLLLRLAGSPDAAEADKLGATAVVEKLGFMPLAISHAGCFMHETKASASEYLRYYEGAFMTVQSRKPKLGWNYRNDTAATAWELSFSEVRKQDEEAASLLLTCSYLSPSEISESLWEDKGSDVESQLRQKGKISLLISYSLIKKSRAGSFSVHPVVHTWARERLDVADQLRMMESAMILIGTALKQTKFSRSKSEWDGREERRMAGHAKHIGKYLKPRFAEFLDYGEGTSSTKDTLDTIHKIAEIFSSQGNYKEAMEWHERVLAGREKTLGKDHPETLKVVNDIAWVLSYQGKYDEALQWYERALIGRESVLGKDHPDTLITVNNMAWIFSSQGKYNKAMQWYERALAVEKDLGKDHPETLTIVNDMALVFSHQGKYSEAIQWHERALTGREKTLGKDHPETLTTVSNMAGVFSKQGKLEEAMQWHERALAGREKALGKGHPATLATIDDIAGVFSCQGKLNEAMQWYERALVGKEKTLGKDHPRTLVTVNSMALVFSMQGKYDAAMEWYERALTGREKALGKDHPETLTTVNGIAGVFSKQGRNDEAVRWHERALAGRKTVLGSDHPDTLAIVSDIALILDSQAKCEKPQPRYKRTFNRFTKVFGKDHSPKPKGDHGGPSNNGNKAS